MKKVPNPSNVHPLEATRPPWAYLHNSLGVPRYPLKLCVCPQLESQPSILLYDSVGVQFLALGIIKGESCQTKSKPSSE